MSSFVRITPTARNAPARVLLNAHKIHRLQEDSQGVVVIMKSAHAVEHLHIAEQSFAVAHAMKAEGLAGQITLRESLEGHPTHQTSFSLADIRAIEQTPSGGAVVRHGIDGSGIFQAAESFEAIAEMIESQPSLEKPLVTVEAESPTSEQVAPKTSTSDRRKYQSKVDRNRPTRNR